MHIFSGWWFQKYTMKLWLLIKLVYEMVFQGIYFRLKLIWSEIRPRGPQTSSSKLGANEVSRRMEQNKLLFLDTTVTKWTMDSEISKNMISYKCHCGLLHQSAQMLLDRQYPLFEISVSRKLCTWLHILLMVDHSAWILFCFNYFNSWLPQFKLWIGSYTAGTKHFSLEHSWKDEAGKQKDKLSEINK